MSSLWNRRREAKWTVGARIERTAFCMKAVLSYKPADHGR